MAAIDKHRVECGESLTATQSGDAEPSAIPDRKFHECRTSKGEALLQWCESVGWFLDDGADSVIYDIHYCPYCGAKLG